MGWLRRRQQDIDIGRNRLKITINNFLTWCLSKVIIGINVNRKSAMKEASDALDTLLLLSGRNFNTFKIYN